MRSGGAVGAPEEPDGALSRVTDSQTRSPPLMRLAREGPRPEVRGKDLLAAAGGGASWVCQRRDARSAARVT